MDAHAFIISYVAEAKRRGSRTATESPVIRESGIPAGREWSGKVEQIVPREMIGVKRTVPDAEGRLAGHGSDVPNCWGRFFLCPLNQPSLCNGVRGTYLKGIWR